ncbi:hypothetical protein K504DRAFT_506561 [Pleomassaria siparia CBS 279.74]|uniref:Heterokaryon incompatibility domain-containing protein n=1 Tax=Pleomassaria siparia CBS 279.74 TaxID=1314801 RepID=A0A6G1JXU6_9PLEO|nr:hypothetical protein K504DRAFT_506561 [Pleomassaria siparia CBS 279.74]
MPSADPQSTIEMVMSYRNLDEHPPYQALSYTGGNPFTSDYSEKLPKDTNDPWEEQTIVTVNGMAFPAKRNLMQALRRFHITHVMQSIWIDSICTNEADPVERSEQVRLMCEVYGERS